MDSISRLRSAIISASLPPPSQSLLDSLVPRHPPPPLPSLLATAKARILASDLTSSPHIDQAALAYFPPNVTSTSTEELRLMRDIHVQVLDIENLSSSRWDQILELEAVAKGERTRGREVIRVTDDDDGEGTEERPPAASSTGANIVHRLVLQDGKGVKVFALEVKRIAGIGVGKTSIGEKMLLKSGVTVARGTILMSPDNVVLLGGKVDAWHKAWIDGRLERLKAAVGEEE